MERGLAPEIFHHRVANFTNSLAIGCNLRLVLKNFISQSHCPRIDQRLLENVFQVNGQAACGWVIICPLLPV